jgi:hypothetical protein
MGSEIDNEWRLRFVCENMIILQISLGLRESSNKDEDAASQPSFFREI